MSHSSAITAHHLILDGDLSPQSVVRVPLLCEGQSVLCPLVFGFQRSSYLAGLGVGRASAGELLQMIDDTHNSVNVEHQN